MRPTYELLTLPFSTADAEAPEVAHQVGELRVTFRDWREQVVTLLFRETIAFQWDTGDSALEPHHRDDECYIVGDSPWLTKHMELDADISRDIYRHYRLCFNALGVLQVLAADLTKTL